MWLYIYFPHLLLESAYQHLVNNTCLAIIDHKKNKIIDTNEHAKAAGLEVDMNLQTAICLAPDLIPIPHEDQQQQEIMNLLINKLRALSAWVSQGENDGIYLEIASMQKLLGDAEGIAEQARNLLKPLSCVIASAPYAKAARLLARSHIEIHLQQTELRGFLNQQNIDALDFTHHDRYEMKRLGIEKLADLLRLRPADIAYRLNMDLAKELDKITGKRRWFPKPSKPKPLFNRKLDLNFEIEESQRLFFPLSKLLKELCIYLKESTLQSNKVVVRCYHREVLPSTLTLTLAHPTQNIDEWLYIARHEIYRFQPPTAIIELHLLCKWLLPMEAHGDNLIDNGAHQQNQGLSGLINKLDARLGSDSYYFLSTSSSPWPEEQTLKTTKMTDCSTHENQHQHQHQHQHQNRRPIFLLDQPKTINRSAYKLLHGPERIDGGWWQFNSCKRDYFIGQHTDGGLHWLYRDDKKQWFIHGYFS